MKKNTLIITLIIISTVNLFSPEISKALISVNTIFNNEDIAYYIAINSYSRSLNAIYIVISLATLTIYIKSSKNNIF